MDMSWRESRSDGVEPTTALWVVMSFAENPVV
jgi:hypothetical protein